MYRSGEPAAAGGLSYGPVVDAAYQPRGLRPVLAEPGCRHGTDERNLAVGEPE